MRGPRCGDIIWQYLLARVCVCVFFYYTPFSSVARGVRYLLQRLWST